MKTEERIYSIPMRLRRIIYEDAYVSVPLTESISEEREDGTKGIDLEKLIQEATRLSQNPRVEWEIETVHSVEPHPNQESVPEDRKSFDPLDL